MIFDFGWMRADFGFCAIFAAPRTHLRRDVLKTAGDLGLGPRRGHSSPAKVSIFFRACGFSHRLWGRGYTCAAAKGRPRAIDIAHPGLSVYHPVMRTGPLRKEGRQLTSQREHP